MTRLPSLRSWIPVLLPLALAACALPPGQIAPDVTKAPDYDGWSCTALSREQSRLDSALTQLSRTQQTAVAADVMTVFLVGIPLSGGGKNKEIAAAKGADVNLARRRAVAGCGA
ncbi:hypothetical protein [Acidimangrovimonas sediminis]|uniref:hypothetical protein n=1 Tax=Acidimangrovimonas sediminis TaxID=2056283 RepID=UPI000C809E78|nr:hypothetical protein [Acidimangrovimonas sediminis]